MAGDPTIAIYGSREARAGAVSGWLNDYANQTTGEFDANSWEFVRRAGNASTSVSLATLAINELRQPLDKSPLGRDEVIDVIEGIRQFILSRSERG